MKFPTGKREMKIALIVLSLFFIICTALPLIREDVWWIRIFDFPRAQIAVGALIVALVFLFFYNRKNLFEGVLLGLLILSIAYQTYRIYPYTFLASPQVLKSEKKNPATKHPLGNTYGMLLYSRLRFVSSEVNFLVEPEIPSIFSVVELRSGDLIDLYCIHPKPPVPTEATETTERDAELLIVGKKAKASSRAVIVMGDLNDVAWSYTTKLFQKISGLLDPRIGRGFYNTFHAKIPVLARFPVDHLFHSRSFRLVDLKVLPDLYSDHFAFFVELSYEPEVKEKQEKPAADKGGKEEAEEKIQKAK